MQLDKLPGLKKVTNLDSKVLSLNWCIHIGNEVLDHFVKEEEEVRIPGYHHLFLNPFKKFISILGLKGGAGAVLLQVLHQQFSRYLLLLVGVTLPFHLCINPGFNDLLLGLVGHVLLLVGRVSFLFLSVIKDSGSKPFIPRSTI
jgi:hypothetical protein